MSCKVCFVNYDHSLKKPLILNPCAHSMCSECESKLIVKNCPSCKNKIESSLINTDLLKFIPESSYDKLKSSIGESLIKLGEIKKEFNNNDGYTEHIVDLKKKVEMQFEMQNK